MSDCLSIWLSGVFGCLQQGAGHQQHGHVLRVLGRRRAPRQGTARPLRMGAIQPHLAHSYTYTYPVSAYACDATRATSIVRSISSRGASSYCPYVGALGRAAAVGAVDRQSTDAPRQLPHRTSKPGTLACVQEWLGG